jgi:predicted N-acetyltransferase YhbS
MMKGIQSVLFRSLERNEVERVWTIDRREIVENVYYLEDGALVLRPEYYDMQGWPPGERELYNPILLDCFDRGGTFIGVFEEADLIGAAVLESKFIGKGKDQLQLKFLHVSNNHRKRGLGRLLFEQAVERARDLNAKRLYISATPSENTVDFYLHLGCAVTEEVDEDLFELEPADIHMEYRIPLSTGR